MALSKECSVSLVCPTTGCRGEDVTRASVWIDKVPAARGRGSGPSPRTRRGDPGARAGKGRRGGGRKSPRA